MDLCQELRFSAMDTWESSCYQTPNIQCYCSSREQEPARSVERREAWESHQHPEESGQEQALWNIPCSCLSFAYPDSNPGLLLLWYLRWQLVHVISRFHLICFYNRLQNKKSRTILAAIILHRYYQYLWALTDTILLLYFQYLCCL